MNCEFDYCIYNKEHTCILGEIQIDSLGMCSACEIVTIPKETLSQYKCSRLQKIDTISNPHNKKIL